MMLPDKMCSLLRQADTLKNDSLCMHIILRISCWLKLCSKRYAETTSDLEKSFVSVERLQDVSEAQFYACSIGFTSGDWVNHGVHYEARTNGSLKCANRTFKNFIPQSVSSIRPLIKDVTVRHNICPVYKFSNEKRHHSLMFSG